MTDRYAAYRRTFEIDTPAPRVLRRLRVSGSVRFSDILTIWTNFTAKWGR